MDNPVPWVPSSKDAAGRSTRPASVMLSRIATPAIRQPAFPAALVPVIMRAGWIHGMHDLLDRSTSSWNTPPTRPVRGRP
jgi:hypothetical protein